jgi:integrase
MDANTQAITLISVDLALKNAIELWASNSTRPETFDRDTKLLDKVSIVKSFFAFINKSVGEITPSDVEEWHNYLTQQGNKLATIYTRLSRLSSFYKWLLSNPHLASYVKYNPVIQARPRCPRPYQSESVKSWSDEETKSIIAIVEAHAKAGSISGKRDYALLLFYLYTGLRRNEVIALRGKDLEYKEGRLIIRYKRKGGKYVGREISQREVYQALFDYLVAADRSEILKTNEPIWIRHDRAKKSTLPLESRAFANNLKKYAKEAGIDNVHVHQTRHTYARIVAEETGSYLETQEALDHENAATTRVYVQRITIKTDKYSNKISKRLNVT